MREMREAWRGLKGAPGASVAALVTLAVGLGISFAIFNLLYAALWQPLPYAHAGELVSIYQSFGTYKTIMVSQPEMDALAAQSTTLSGVGMYRGDMGVVTGHGPAKQVNPVHVNAALFAVLGAGPVRGRAFTAADMRPGAAPVMLISTGFAQKRFGTANPLGQTLSYNGVAHRVVGIVAADFSAFLGPGQSADVLLPLAPNPNLKAAGYSAIGRLRPGVTLGAASGEAAAVMSRLAQAHPKDLPPGDGFSLTGLAASQHQFYGATPWLLVGAAGLILLLACVNVASLLLARVTGREREFAIRQALGAPRGRLLRQILCEGLGLGLAGGFFAWWIAWAMLHILTVTKPPYAWMRAHSGALVPLAFAVGVSVAAGLVCSLVPAWRASHALAAPARSANAPRRLRGGVIALEVALALVLAISAGLLIRTVEHLQAVSLGFNPEHVLTADVLLPRKTFGASSQASELFFTHLLARARPLPGVHSAALASTLPMDGAMFTRTKIDGHFLPMQMAIVSPGYFSTLGIPLLRGRGFAATDSETAPKVVIVDQSLAASAWPGRNPLGQTLTMQDRKHAGPWTVIGVVHDTHQMGIIRLPPAMEPRAMAYFPRAQYPAAGYGIALRTAGDPGALTAPLRRVIAGLSPDAVYTPETMSATLTDSIAQQRFLRLLLELAAALALALAVIGIYGTISYWVSQRTQEVGVRMALGARRGHVLGLILGRTLRWAIVGVMVGGAAAYAAGRGLASILFEVKPADPASVAAGVGILLMAAMLAAWLPARRAAAVDPVEALRHE